MALDRAYSFKDVDMLIAAKTVAGHFTAHKAAIVSARATWADPFIKNYELRIDKAVKDYLGLDPKKELKEATQVLTEIQAKALKGLSFFKVQIEADYSANKVKLNTLLSDLGFSSHWAAASKRDQQALTQLLFEFRKNMTGKLETELVQKGIGAALIDDLQSYADTLNNANIHQETLKSSTKNLTDAGTLEFNEIYEQAIAICKISSNLFRDDKSIQAKFAFRQIVARMGKAKASTPVVTP